MKPHSYLIVLLLMAPALAGCSYFDVSGAPPETAKNVESFDLMTGDYRYEARDISEVILESTDGSVQVFPLDQPTLKTHRRVENKKPSAPLVATLESAGMAARDVEPAKTTLPGGYMPPPTGSAPVIPRSMDRSVDVFSLDVSQEDNVKSQGTLKSGDYVSVLAPYE